MKLGEERVRSRIRGPREVRRRTDIGGDEGKRRLARF